MTAQGDGMPADPSGIALAEGREPAGPRPRGPDRPARSGAPPETAAEADLLAAPGIPGLRALRMQDILSGLAIRSAFLAADLLAAVLAFLLAFLLAASLHTLLGRPYYSFSTFIVEREAVLAVMLVLMIAVFSFGGLYSRTFWDVEEIKRIFLASGLLGLFHAAFQVLTEDYTMRLWFLIVWPLLAMLSVLLRAGLRSLPAMRRALTRHVLLVGRGISPEEFAFQLRETQANPVRVVETVPMDDLAACAGPGLRRHIAEAAGRAGVPAASVMVVLAPDPAEQPLSRHLSERLWIEGLAFSSAMPEEIPARRGQRFRKITGLDMMLAETDPPALSLSERALKRAMDVLAAGLVLLLVAPAMLVIALMLLPGGSVFFGQSRVGRGGRRFRCLKFRSMRPDAEARLRQMLETDPAARAEWAAFQKLARDPRITPFGRFLRTSSLDELPQLLNVLAGDMSLVGPRPIVAPEVPGYARDHAYFASPDFAWYAAFRPGITGLWQVSGRATTWHDERVRLDRWYVRNWSIWLDIAILIKTIRVVLFARTAS